MGSTKTILSSSISLSTINTKQKNIPLNIFNSIFENILEVYTNFVKEDINVNKEGNIGLILNHHT